MSYFADLSGYTYFPSPRSAKNIGWLDHVHQFEKSIPVEETLKLLWMFCTISVEHTRGVHYCELCSVPTQIDAERNGLKLSLGRAEIRVFSMDNEIYAAPNLIYHYVAEHHYNPPDEFLRSLRESPIPPQEEYFRMLNALGVDWENTWTPIPKHTTS